MENVATKNKKVNNQKVGVRKWFIFVLIGLIGQFAWAVENMYLNSYITYLNFTDPTGVGFNYSTLIAITTAASAIVATLTTIFMGSLSDKVNKRKIFISTGYIIWGISTASFGLLNVNSDASLFAISMTAYTAAIMVIVIDCVMTFFGSTSNDAAFNSYVTKNTTNENRGKVEGVLSILPLIAMLIIFVGLNSLTTEASGYRWDLFFYIVGGLVTVVGLISIWLIPKEKKEEKTLNEGYTRYLIEGFKPKTVKENKLLYLVLLAYFIYGVAIQVYFPYLMIYVQYTCNISNTGESFLTPFAIVMAVALLLGSLLSVVIGFISDKLKKENMMVPVIIILMIGLLLMFFIPYVNDDTLRTVYGSFAGLVMILGYVSVPTILNSMVKDNIPKGKEGSFMGVRMLFVTALPMCVGPFIGDALNAAYGKYYISEYGVESVVPSERGYIVGIAILVLSFIPIYFIIKEIKKQNKGKNKGYLISELKDIDEKELEFDLSKHPRPQFNRDKYLLLNGAWDIKITKDEKLPTTYDKEVIVPFAVESPLSKVNHLLNADEYIYYHKKLDVPPTFNKEHVFLNFEGVDQTCWIYLNNQLVYQHVGGYTRFNIDLKPHIINGTVDVVVKVKDVSDDSYHQVGKQRLAPTSAWFYSSSSGIYKPVYIESTPKNYIKSVKYKERYDEKSFLIYVETNIYGKVEVHVDDKIFNIESNKWVKITPNKFIPWSLENPHLYEIKLKFYDDVVNSYYGIRKIEIKGDKEKQIYLNNKRVFLNGLLDQGYYYLGGLTPRSYDEYYTDIKNIKDLGYNCLRKHVKVEMDYFYYYADKLGVLIIQDIPNGGEKTKFLDVVIPRISYKLFNDEKFLTYKKYGRLSEEGRIEYYKDLDDIIEATSSFPSIVIYTPFNEAWGEFDPQVVYQYIKDKNIDQLIDTASGWIDTVRSDFFSIHSYTLPARKRYDPKGDNRPYVLTEIGGTALKIDGHYDYPSLYGHGKCKDSKQLETKYTKLYRSLIKRIEDNNLNGIIYTQLNDCETEANGIYTLDRKVLKLDKEVIKNINKEIENSL